MDIAVVGAGIAGLATALALSQRGHAVRVLERAPALGDVGAGLQLSPNGMAVIAALGLRNDVLGAGLRAEAVTLRREDGRRVVRLALAAGGMRGDWVLIHRARLIALLAQAAAASGVTLELGRRVSAVADGAAAATVETDAGRADCRLVVGADGIRGLSRGMLGQRDAPVFSGQVAWRAIIPRRDDVVSPEVFMGARRHLVSYALDGGLRNLVAVEERERWAEDSWSALGDAEELRSAFAGFAPKVRRWLDAVSEVHLWGLFDRPVARRWHGSRVVLVGDAAHPTLPFLAQGANLALEDAWALADCVARLPVDAALPAYQARRRGRALRAIAAASRNARNYHLSPGPMRWMAHATLGTAGLLAPRLLLRRLDWLYGHDETGVA